MKIFGIITCLAAVCLMAGCVSVKSERKIRCRHNNPEKKKDYWSSRMSAASKMKHTDHRDDAYHSIAMDAANAAEGKVARKAVSKIKYIDRRDRTAADVAMKLSRNGQRKDAIEVAERIRNRRLRDKTLKKLATRKRHR